MLLQRIAKDLPIRLPPSTKVQGGKRTAVSTASKNLVIVSHYNDILLCMKQVLTIVCKLQPTKEQTFQIEDTLAGFANACNHINNTIDPKS